MGTRVGTICPSPAVVRRTQFLRFFIEFRAYVAMRFCREPLEELKPAGPAKTCNFNVLKHISLDVYRNLSIDYLLFN